MPRYYNCKKIVIKRTDVKNLFSIFNKNIWDDDTINRDTGYTTRDAQNKILKELFHIAIVNFQSYMGDESMVVLTIALDGQAQNIFYTQEHFVTLQKAFKIIEERSQSQDTE